MPPGKHEALLVHATHVPLLQTSLVPQGEPLGRFVAVAALQTDVPVAHDVTLVLQALPPGVQLEPDVQLAQRPLPSQT